MARRRRRETADFAASGGAATGGGVPAGRELRRVRRSDGEAARTDSESMRAARVVRWRGQLTLNAVSSMTNDVCSELSSVPVNLIVTELPATPDNGNVTCV